MERVDSGTTDDSPFASSLTTPVNEDVCLQLYHSHGLGMGIEERLYVLPKGREGINLRDSGSAIHVGSPDNVKGRGAVVSEREFRKELEKKLSTLHPSLLTATTNPLPIPPNLRDSISGGSSAASTPDLHSLSGSSSTYPVVASQVVSRFSTAESTPDLRPRSGSIYNLPNEPIVVETKSQQFPQERGTNMNTCSTEGTSGSDSHCAVSQHIYQAPDLISGDAVSVVKGLDISRLEISHRSPQNLDSAAVDPLLDDSSDSVRFQKQYDFSELPFAETAEHSSLFTFLKTRSVNLTFMQFSSVAKALLPLLLRIIFFLPWCVAVGGTIVMFPKHLEFIAFRPGYLKSPKGIHRFVHWADTGMQHVWIFLGFLASMWWIYPAIGWVLVGGVVAQTVNAWHDFEVDRSVPLGEDDRQTMYLVATQYGVQDELMGIRKADDGYVISKLDRPHAEHDDLDDSDA